MVRATREFIRNADLDSTMTPMIDIVFLLLVFFVWTYGFQAAEMIMPNQLAALGGGINAQSEPPPAERDFDPIVIRVGWQGDAVTWSINQSPLPSAEALRQNLDAIHAVRSAAPIIVHPDPQVPLGFVIQAFDLSRLAGFSKVSLAANL